MGKMADIRALLEQRQTIREVESKGFVLATIRRVAGVLEHERQVAEVAALHNTPTADDPESNIITPDNPEQEDLEMSAAEVKDITVKLEQLTKAVTDKTHLPGLCESPDCDPCKTSKKAWGSTIAAEVRDHLIGEMTAACEWSNAEDLLAAVSDIYERWQAEGRPKPTERQASTLEVAGIQIVP